MNLGEIHSMMIMQSHNYIYEGEIAEEQELTFKQFERILSNNEICGQ